ncbi:MAG: DMT family transporter [Magnetococcales bacterium]|nr:DMT family transporter [Magnetococcales bacterium]
MTVALAFTGIVLIWGSTPLAVQWSMDNVGFPFAVMARMVLGLVVCLVVLGVAKTPMPFHRTALMTYLSGGLGILGAMTTTYWAAQHIPSGWVSVLFGLTPMVTGLLAWLWLSEKFGWERWLGTLLGVGGLMIIFIQGSASGSTQAAYGIGAMVLSVFIYAISTVNVKRIGGNVSALATTVGSLTVATPGFILIWLLDGGQFPVTLSLKAAGSIVYLAVMASAVGFMLFYFLLSQLQTGQTMLITLMAPLVAVALGRFLNSEYLDNRFLLGVGMILLGLVSYQWGTRTLQRIKLAVSR